jgi:ABC-type bacteriocin/lantibiotic exporter with double-glycine peptidase domain
MVARFYGLSIPKSVLQRTLGYTPIGTPAGNVVNLHRLGFTVQMGYAKNEGVLFAALQNGVPPICMVDTAAFSHWNESAQHAVVVTDLDASAIVLNDPAFARHQIRVDLKEFLLAWSDMDLQYVLLTR